LALKLLNVAPCSFQRCPTSSQVRHFTEKTIDLTSTLAIRALSLRRTPLLRGKPFSNRSICSSAFRRHCAQRRFPPPNLTLKLNLLLTQAFVALALTTHSSLLLLQPTLEFSLRSLRRFDTLFQSRLSRLRSVASSAQTLNFLSQRADTFVPFALTTNKFTNPLAGLLKLLLKAAGPYARLGECCSTRPFTLTKLLRFLAQTFNLASTFTMRSFSCCCTPLLRGQTLPDSSVCPSTFNTDQTN
jgi:hypothetical protein